MIGSLRFLAQSLRPSLALRPLVSTRSQSAVVQTFTDLADGLPALAPHPTLARSKESLSSSLHYPNSSLVDHERD
ncbi:uncharacterized protein HD556DRAFT_255668 [Suillus plorans]|uniref:Uncharacterized protein n=1 Tax=Suillus plorans TaxID=116603 RepID=A0A9P7DL08_9AGAM|nr:uncharacterized protein HD556DRAFT_255668 [Suillus plorans]KAG1797431.1 hypothetical protein HD556DRAFT_255668 [Suillus plorans]